jgi:hypothetical protein
MVSDEPDLDDSGNWRRLTPDEALAMLKEGRREMLELAIEILESVTPQRAMTAGLEVLRAALADLDAWEKGTAEVLERDIALSLGQMSEH